MKYSIEEGLGLRTLLFVCFRGASQLGCTFVSSSILTHRFSHYRSCGFETGSYKLTGSRISRALLHHLRSLYFTPLRFLFQCSCRLIVARKLRVCSLGLALQSTSELCRPFLLPFHPTPHFSAAQHERA